MVTQNSCNSNDPAQVAKGGTGLATLTTAYGVVCAGTTATGALQNAGAGTDGQLLSSNGGSSLPSFKTYSVNIQVFTSSDTYTPTSGMQYAIIEVVGSGGGGGGTATGGANIWAVGGGGGGGNYSRIQSDATSIGASQTVTIGAAGAGGAAGNNAGTAGADCSFGTICVGKGGSGGGGNSGSGAGTGGAGGVAGTGDFSVPGQSGGYTFPTTNVLLPQGGGGSSLLGYGGRALANTGTGINASLYGAGGSGGGSYNGAGTNAGGNGSAGIVIVTEFILA